MVLQEVLKPIHHKHSIREAVISIFLVTPIVKPERFRSILEADLKEKFQLFETLQQFQFEIIQEKGVLQRPEPTVENNAGFKCSAFQNGKLSKVLQGVNEESRTFISFHSLDYNRWDDFYSEFKAAMEIVDKHHKELYIRAFSLHYIDEFTWLKKDGPVELNIIFNEDYTFLPRHFFDSNNPHLKLTVEKNVSSTPGYFDRIEIKVEKKMFKSVVISHNVTQQLSDFADLTTLLNGSFFDALLVPAHHRNKDFLKNILKPEVQDLIGLK